MVPPLVDLPPIAPGPLAFLPPHKGDRQGSTISLLLLSVGQLSCLQLFPYRLHRPWVVTVPHENVFHHLFTVHITANWAPTPPLRVAIIIGSKVPLDAVEAEAMHT